MDFSFTQQSFDSASWGFKFLLAFFGGLISVATPCVFPLIPITLALFGATDAPRKRAFLLSLLYVLGIALTYTALGLFAAQAGGFFGSALGNPWIVSGISIFLVVLALYTLDIIKLSFFHSLQTKASKVGGKGFFGAFLMGAASGFVAAPCAGPVLVLILGVAATSNSSLFGGLLLFVYALGFGLPFLLLGTFSGGIKALPRAGNWLFGVKFIIAAALLMVPMFLLRSFLPAFFGSISPVSSTFPALALLVSGLAVALYAFRVNASSGKAIASAAVALGAFHLIITPMSVSTQNDSEAWVPSLPKVIETTQKSFKPAMVDLYADWCAACIELAQKTFPAPEVKDALNKFVLGRIDFTQETDETTKLSEKYDVKGLPTLLFLDPEGKEIPDSRVTGFMEPGAFKSHLDKVLGKFDSKK